MIVDSFTQLKLTSSFIIERQIQPINSRYDTVIERNSAFDKIINQLKQYDCFDGYLALMKAGVLFSFDSEMDRLMRFLNHIISRQDTFYDNLEITLNSHSLPDNILIALFTCPFIPNFDMVLAHMKTLNITPYVISMIVPKSLSMTNFRNLTTFEIESIQSNISRVIKEFSGFPNNEFFEYFAWQCIKLISPAFTDTQLNREFLKKIENSEDLITLMIIAFNRRFLKIFLQLARFPTNSPSLFIKRLPLDEDFEFVKLFPYDLICQIYGVANVPIYFRKHNYFDSIINTLDILLFRIERENESSDLKFDTGKYVNFVFRNASVMLEEVIKNSENPARKVHTILSALKYHFSSQENVSHITEKSFCSTLPYSYFLEEYFSSINSKLNDKYIKSLLKPENVDIFDLPIADVFINISSKNFLLLSKLATEIGPENISTLLRHVVLNWDYILEGFSMTQYEIFFNALGFGNNSYTLVKELKGSERSIINSIINDSSLLFLNRGYSKYLGKVLLKVVFNNFKCDYKSAIKENPEFINPLRFKLRGIYEFLLEKNPVQFVLYGPKEIIQVFKPFISNHLLKKEEIIQYFSTIENSNENN